jgi:hypothetical protein
VQKHQCAIEWHFPEHSPRAMFDYDCIFWEMSRRCGEMRLHNCDLWIKITYFLSVQANGTERREYRYLCISSLNQQCTTQSNGQTAYVDYVHYSYTSHSLDIRRHRHELISSQYKFRMRKKLILPTLLFLFSSEWNMVLNIGVISNRSLLMCGIDR